MVVLAVCAAYGVSGIPFCSSSVPSLMIVYLAEPNPFGVPFRSM